MPKYVNLLEHIPTSGDEGATIRVDAAVRSPYKVSPQLFGKFCEHLGFNIYGGMEAQILFNPTLGRWSFTASGSDVSRPDGGIVVFTRTGSSALRLSKERPQAAIHAFAPQASVCRRLGLAWGVRPQRLPAGRGTDAVVAQVVERLRAQESWASGDRAVLVMGAAHDPAGATTLIKLLSL